MRRAVQTVLAALFLAGAPVLAEEKPPAAAEDCATRSGVLGVSRIVEIDTTGGPLLGQHQYRDLDFLADGEVVLTFDDGPLRRHTLPVLDALEAECAKATFFIVGRMALADPETLKEVALRGHTVGTHTWSHRNLRAIGEKGAEKEIEYGLSAASQALGQPVAPFFRFPYLSDSKRLIDYLKSRNQAIFSIDIDTKDYRTRSASEVQRRALAGLADKKKGIILFHDIQTSTARALKGLLAELRTRGYKIVHLTAKQPAATLPEYDAIAQKELARRVLAAAASPLAARSLMWPNMLEDEEEEAEPKSHKPARGRRGRSKRPSGALKTPVKDEQPATARDDTLAPHSDLLRQ